MQMSPDRLVFGFEELGQEQYTLVGKKCANLGEMTRMGLPVPPGFAVSTRMYRRFVEETGAAIEISRCLTSFGELRDQSIAVFDELGRSLRAIIESKELPEEMVAMVASHYKALGQRVGHRNVAVSVRSAGIESRPGMFETYLNVIGVADVLDRVRKVWASAFTARAIAFRVSKNIPPMADELGVAVCRMVNTRSSGVGFTVDPVTGDTANVIIDANWGLGEGVVSGEEGVDRFVVNKKDFAAVQAHIGKKARHVVSKARGVAWEDVPPEKQLAPCLSDDAVVAIARLAVSLEERLGQPQDVEWAVDYDASQSGNIVLLQTRPAKVAARKIESITDHMIDLIAKRFHTP